VSLEENRDKGECAEGLGGSEFNFSMVVVGNLYYSKQLMKG
jgi:hypothetical protein